MAFNWRVGLGEGLMAAGDALGRSFQLRAALDERRSAATQREKELKDAAEQRAAEQRAAINRGAGERAVGARNLDEVALSEQELIKGNPPDARGPDFQAAMSTIKPARQRIQREQQVLLGQDITDIVRKMATDPEMTAEDAINELRSISELRRSPLPKESLAAATRRFEGAFAQREQGEASVAAAEARAVSADVRAGRADARAEGEAARAADREEREKHRFKSIQELTNAQAEGQRQINAERAKGAKMSPTAGALPPLLSTTGGVLAIRKDMLTTENIGKALDGEIELRDMLVEDIGGSGYSKSDFILSQINAQSPIGGLGDEQDAKKIIDNAAAIWDRVIAPALGQGGGGAPAPAPAPGDARFSPVDIARKLRQNQPLTDEERAFFDSLSDEQVRAATRAAQGGGR